MATPKSRVSPRQCLQFRLEMVADLLQQLVDVQLNDDKPNGHRKAAQPKRKGAKSAKTEEPSTSKLLHDLRVSCRRAEIAVKVCPQELTRKQAAWFRDQLQSVRDSCNVLRDDEVLRKWLRNLPDSDPQQELLKSISKNIKAGHNEAAKRARALLQRRHFLRHVDEWRSDAPAGHGSTALPAVWRGPLGRSLFESINRLIQAIPDSPDDHAALHQLRIAAKRLRYGAELAGELEPRLQLADLIKLLTQMQDKLGELHDAVVRLERLTAESDKLSEAGELLTAARDELAKRLAIWRTWWQANILQKIVKQTGSAASKLLDPATR